MLLDPFLLSCSWFISCTLWVCKVVPDLLSLNDSFQTPWHQYLPSQGWIHTQSVLSALLIHTHSASKFHPKTPFSQRNPINPCSVSSCQLRSVQWDSQGHCFLHGATMSGPRFLWTTSCNECIFEDTEKIADVHREMVCYIGGVKVTVLPCLSHSNDRY